MVQTTNHYVYIYILTPLVMVSNRLYIYMYYDYIIPINIQSIQSTSILSNDCSADSSNVWGMSEGWLPQKIPHGKTRDVISSMCWINLNKLYQNPHGMQ